MNDDYIKRSEARRAMLRADSKSVHLIEAIPAADVRPVVLCRDCKWWRGEGTICKGIGIDFDADGFCCEGERKDGADMREEQDGR